MSATKIYQYIESKKYVPAKSLIDTELAVSPDSCVYQSLDALLAFKLNQRTKALTTLDKVVASKQLNATIVTSLVSPVLIGYNLPRLLNTAFEVVNRKTPSDKQLVETWIECSLILGDLKMFCKSLLANNKQQQSRKSAFQTCFALYLVFESVGPTEPERKLYPTLAARMLEPHLPVKSKNEFYTQVMVTTMNSSITPLLEQYPDMALDLTLQQFFIDDLTKAQQWQDLMDYSTRVLDRIDTFNCWQALNTAAVELGKTEEAAEYISKYSKSNNTQLALVDLAEKSGSDLITALDQYWKNIQHKACVYEYLKPYTSHPKFSEVILTAEPESFVAKVNRIKLQYHINPKVDTHSLIQLYQQHLDHIPTESTDYFIGSDLLIIGAIQLLKEKQYMNALLLLEYASSNDKSNFYIRLWLMAIYRHFGSISLVQQQYSKLSIKNLQHESLGHLLALHAGTLGLDLKQFADLKKMYHQSDNMFSATNMALDSQVFCQIPSMLELQRKMNTSLTRSLFNIEEIKCQRINRGETDMREIVNMTPPLADNRDLKTFFDPLGELESLGFGNFKAEYIHSLLDREKLFLARLRGESQLPTVQKVGLTPAEQWSVACLESNQLMPLPDLTTADSFSGEFIHTVYTIIETMKLLTDISLKHKKKVDFKQERKHLKQQVEAALSSTQSFAEPLAWAVEYRITGAESVIVCIVNSHNKVLNSLVSLLK